MITTNENAWNDDVTNQNQGGGSNSFGTPDAGDTTNQNFSDDADTDSTIDENSLDDTEGGGNIPGSYSSNESMSGTNSPDDDDDLANDDEDLLDDDTDLATGDDIADDDLADDEDDDLDADFDEDPAGTTETHDDLDNEATGDSYSTDRPLA